MREKIKQLHAKGYTNIEIARELNRHKTRISCIMKELGLKPNKKKSLIDKHKLKDMYESGKSYKEICSELNISHATIIRMIPILGMKRIKKEKEKVMKKPVPATLQRESLNKGYTESIVKEIVLSPNRDEGRIVRLKYSDISDIPTVMCAIRVKSGDITDEQAVINWGRKMGKRSVCLC